MTKVKFKKPEAQHIKGICVKCNKNKQTNNGKNKYKPLCRACCFSEGRVKVKNVALRYRLHKGDVCEACGFVPVNKCQLDVDHIDGDHSNDDPSNLQTLCANCHRLKTYLNKDYIEK